MTIYAGACVALLALCAFIPVANADVQVEAIVPGTCGNDKNEVGEQCDGSDLGGATCQSLGYDRGTLSCSGSCSYDVSQCEQTSSAGASGDSLLSKEDQDELTRATVSGRGYPGTKIALLVDGEREVTSITNSEGEFTITTSQVSPGLHSLSVVVVSDDIKGGKTETVTVRMKKGLVTQVSGLVFSPAFDSVSRKRPPLRLRFSGLSVPNQRIRITAEANSEQTMSARSSNSGRWSATTTPLIGYGQSPLRMEFQAGMTYNGSVHNSPIFTTDIFENWLPGDFNFDGRVNSVDFYILRYWYLHSQTAAPDTVDLNNDGQVSLADFSYLSYYWTG